MKDNLAVDERTIIIGHSSGACAAVRSVFLTTLVLVQQSGQCFSLFWCLCSCQVSVSHYFGACAAVRSVPLTTMGVCSCQSVSLNAVELVKLSGLSFS
jgi:hypothetical protein